VVLVRNVEIIRIGVPSLGVGVQIGERQGRGQSAQTIDPFFRRRLQQWMDLPEPGKGSPTDVETMQRNITGTRHNRKWQSHAGRTAIEVLVLRSRLDPAA
jgi:hypothetical protein